jgi:glycosyltransferase involved in cell wall biosynthesis
VLELNIVLCNSVSLKCMYQGWPVTEHPIGTSHILAWLRTFLSSKKQPFVPLSEFDPEFYRRYYADLKDFEVSALRRHYRMHGKAEGRFASWENLIAELEKRHGNLPKDFDAGEYRAANPDLAKAGLTTDWHAIEHFLRHGKTEGRPIVKFDAEIYRDLYFKGQIVSDETLLRDFEDVGRRLGRIGTCAEFVRLRGYDGGSRWIEALQTDEFAQLNFTWAGSVQTKIDAVEAMMEEGISRLAPISFSREFDASFYREFRPDLATSSDEQCYRHWLFTGFESGDPGSPGQFFDSLGIDLRAYPASFPWQSYRRTHMRGRGSRWDALGHFLEQGFERGVRPTLSGDDAAATWLALGERYRNRDDTLSIEAFDLARKARASPGHWYQDLADCHFRLGHWAPALEAYRGRMDLPGADVWTYCNGARAALKLGDIALAFEILRKGKDKVVGAPEWRKALRDAIEAQFGAASKAAHELLRSGSRGLADRLVTKSVAEIVKLWSEFDPLGVPLPVAPNGKIVILANVDLRQCTHYRVEQKQQLLETLGRAYQIYAASEVEDFISALPGAAAAIFYRLPAFPMNVRAIEVARALGIPTYYEIDDLVFESAHYPEPFETYGGAITDEFYRMLQFGTPLFRAAMSLCDFGIASTRTLAAHMKPIVRQHEVFVLPNGLDDRNNKFLACPPNRVRRDGSIVIFYGSGTKAHNSDFLDLAGDALATVMEHHAEVRLMIVGHLSLDARFEPFLDRIVRIGWVPDARSFWSLLAEADINIAVLATYATTDAKSEIKWLEAAAMAIPSVVSATAHYREVLEDRVDALLADSPESWLASLERLVVDPTLRRSIGEKARAKAAAGYSLEAHARILASFLPAVPGEPARIPAGVRKRRILVENLFFPPQTLGGSTRVARDNIDCFLTLPAAEELEFAVVTTDLYGEGTNSVRVENYRGCPVFRLSTPDIPPMEWWPRHLPTGRKFRDILELWKPDLVHFHCVQRLSGSIVEETVRADIPYIVTLHDAWWVSDWQFLSDHRNRLREPGEPFPFDPPSQVTVGDALDRRRLLASLLEGAEEILAVSRAFTDIYQKCGFTRTITVSNGVPPLAPIARIPSASGRVRLAHIGSMTKFKGYFLVQAAFKQSRFQNLELTVVDHSRYGGNVELAQWGTTPVRFVGKTVQEEMHKLYAEVDVLLAPSLWPESFGLVSREALSCGAWVVASDRGAMGEDVVPGVNGWRIDVATPRALIETLAEIDENPGLYLSRPPQLPLKTAHEQAAETLKVYLDVLARERRPKPIPAFLADAIARPSPPRPKFDLRERSGGDVVHDT